MRTCKDCKQEFESDSPHNDVYCGNCRIQYQDQRLEQILNNDSYWKNIFGFVLW